MWRLAIIFPILILYTFSANGQDTKVASLLEKLEHSMHDTARVNLYYSISKHYWDRNADSSALMAQKVLDLAESINYKKGIALGCLTWGVALQLKGNYSEALKYHLKGLRLSEELNLTALSGNNYNNIGIVYSSLGNHKKGIEFYEKALTIAETYGTSATNGILANLSDAYTNEKRYDQALQYGLRALMITQEQKDSSGIAINLFNIGEIYRKTDNLNQAINYLNESIAISSHIGDRLGVSYCLNSLAEVYVAKGMFHKAIDHAKRSLGNLEQAGDKELTLGAYHILYTSYAGLNNFEQALDYRNREISLKENLFSIVKERETNNLQAEYDLERKQHQIELLEKDSILQQKEIARASFEKGTYAVGLVLFITLTVYLVLANSKRKKFNIFLKERNSLIVRQKEKINEQNIHLEKLNAVKTRLISIISHDFRSPLHSLQGLVQLMNNKDLKREETALMTEQINDKLIVTLHLIENLLHWSINQMNGLVLNPNHFDLKEVVDGNVKLVQSSAEHKRIEIVNGLGGRTMVFADKETINIILRNLMTNALKFSKHGGKICLSVVEKEKHLQVNVRDTGIGILAEKQRTVFDGMMSSTTAGTSNEKGTGLGLALCKELVEKNGGQIWVESEPGRGSTFMFTIPRDLNEVLAENLKKYRHPVTA